jgi:hypothetical protein
VATRLAHGLEPYWADEDRQPPETTDVSEPATGGAQ